MSLPHPAIQSAMLAIFGPGRVSAAPAECQAYSRDLWPLRLLEMRAGTVHPAPACVVWPESSGEISRLLAWAQKNKVPVTPWGGGSGVCGGAIPAEGGIVLDLKRMDRTLSLDRISLTVTAQTGILGQILEERLEREGYTLGHFPSSLYCSTLGGWLATRSAGQLSSRYGKIEDMALGLEAVLPDGRLLRTRVTPRSATGPSLLQLLLGSEGTLGVITQATLAIHPLPQERLFQAYLWKEMAKGLEGVRRLVQTGLRPALVRLYDETDTALAMRAQGIEGKGCLLLLAFEGHPDTARVESSLGSRILKASGAEDLGSEPARHWWAHRYDVSYQQSVVLQQEGTFLDTIEVAATWDRLEALYLAMREAMAPMALVMAHVSHVYPQGASIYFTVVGKAPGREAERYREIWDKAMGACLAQGAAISHHHGIGRLKARWMAEEHGDGMEVLRAIKRVLDPHGILNPGNMGL
jgi:alkyldihydroxyacetonephosphate synthase